MGKRYETLGIMLGPSLQDLMQYFVYTDHSRISGAKTFEEVKENARFLLHLARSSPDQVYISLKTDRESGLTKQQIAILDEMVVEHNARI